MMLLFCDRPAGNARPGIPRGVALHVIRRGVDYEGGSAVAENGMGTGAECYVRRDDTLGGTTVGRYRKVLHISSVGTAWILQPVFFVLGIEMSASGCESGWFARRMLMNMNRMLAGRQIFYI